MIMFTKDTHSKPNEQFFPKQEVIQLPNWKQQLHLIYLFSILNFKTELNRIHTVQEAITQVDIMLKTLYTQT